MARLIFHNTLTGSEISFRISNLELVISEYQHHTIGEIADWLSMNQYDRLTRKFPSFSHLIVKLKV